MSEAPDEAVGTLLVHQKDLQELSKSGPPMSPPQVNLKKRVTVGTLLVPPSDLESTPEEKVMEANIKRRVTKAVNDALNAPPPDVDDPSQWGAD